MSPPASAQGMRKTPVAPESGRKGLVPDIAAYYERFPESARLQEGPGQLEFVRTTELIERYAPSPPARVLDVGGGPGAYAVPLAERGYEVHLVDPVPRLVAEARRQSQSGTLPIASCTLGDARQLEWPSGAVDMVLLLGPLYHLTDPGDRMLALAEAFRVLRPGGLLFAAGISRFASALDGLVRDLFRDPEFANIVTRDLMTGQHRNPTGHLDYFTTAFFHHPDELRRELGDAGFILEGLYGLEGPGWMLQDFERRWAEPRTQADLLRIARAVESEPSLLGLSAHLLGVGRRRGSGEAGKQGSGKAGQQGNRAGRDVTPSEARGRSQG
jgi:ubiquinone/menaquinone biosynthesis C-methylase UbiE